MIEWPIYYKIFLSKIQKSTIEVWVNVMDFQNFSKIFNLPTEHKCLKFPNPSSILYILRGFRKLVITFFPVKNTPKLINQQLKNGVKLVNWKKKVSYCFFYSKKYAYLKLKNEVKIVN